MELTKPVLRQMSTDIVAALAEVSKKYGVGITYGGGRFTSTNATLKLEVAVIGGNGVAVDRRAEIFKLYAKMYGFEPTDLGKTFVSNGVTFTISGLDPKKRQYPIIATNPSGKPYKFPADRVKAGIGSSSPAAATSLASTFAPTTKRPESEIMKDIAGVYGNLSPENLTCDGELSARQVRHRRRDLNRQLESLFTELGRRVSETEAFGL